MVALSFAADATSRICWHANLFILAYRNPFLAAKSIATLDVLSGGRVIVGIGVGYLEEEFEALGASFADRGDRTDEAIAAGRGWRHRRHPRGCLVPIDPYAGPTARPHHGRRHRDPTRGDRP
jgi:alkanesulfonate monooxygenase SsuD/methylene tetrahydromethanopterin reductase-like flavin-dependent oxidoreductase (luciferase family)